MLISDICMILSDNICDIFQKIKQNVDSAEAEPKQPSGVVYSITRKVFVFFARK